MAEGPVTAVDFDYSIRKSWIKSDIYGNNIKSKKIPYCKRIVLARWYQLEFFFLPIITGQIERCNEMSFKETRSITAIYLSQLFWS